MISRPPFNTWPLHVKLFTHEANQFWTGSTVNDPDDPPLPPGFTCTLELEGVDGKSGHRGSGRQGPISVNDEEFASTILAKNTAIAAGGNVECVICREPILNYAISPLSTALCPSSKCHAVSHSMCLSQYFISQEDQPTTMVPRGGHCKSCKQYTLWGDIIRGCYRRMPPSEVTTSLLDIDILVSDDLEVREKTKSSRRRKKSVSPTKRRKSSKAKGKQRLRSGPTSTSHESETFDFSNLVTSSESEDIPGPVKRKPGRPRAALSPPTIRQPSFKGSGKQKQSAKSASTTSTEGKSFNLKNRVASLEIEDDATPMKRKRGRPRRDLTILSLGVSSSVSSPRSLKVSRKMEASVWPKLSSKGKGNQSSSPLSTSEGETFDFGNLVASSNGGGTSTPAKKKRGRPNKDMLLLSPNIPLDINTKKPESVARQESSKEKGKQKRALSSLNTSEDETFGLNNLVASLGREDTSTSIKRQRGRPRKTPAAMSPPIIAVCTQHDKPSSILV